MENQQDIKIFLVDDDAFSLNMYQQNILNLGFSNISIFSNGVDCLNNLHQKPEIIFIDHNMDVLTGFEVLKKIKRVDPNIYVVMVSAQENMKTAVEALKYGAFDYIIKGDDEATKMQKVIDRIFLIKEEIRNSNPSFLQKILSIF
ncbi:response regulator [Sphingobacteriaceae bacterium]|nr:response regulator [Sphingobacteriaceae bacterium]